MPPSSIDVDYEVLPAVVDCVAALRSGAPQIHDEAPGNTCYTWALGDKAAVDAAFAKAAHVTKLDIVNNRLIPNAIEPRAAVASYDRGADAYTLYVAEPEPARRAPADDGVRAGPAGAQGARDRARRRRRLRLEDLPLRRGNRDGRGRRSASRGRSSGPPSAASRSSPTPTVATTSRTPSWRSTRTASSSAMRVITTANMGAYLSHVRLVHPDVSSTRRCSPGSTPRRRSTAR